MTENKKNYICACAEGEERSVAAVEMLREKGFNCKLLPGGLETFEEYLLGEKSVHDPRIDRQFNRGNTSIKHFRSDYNSKYNRILQMNNSTWLVFIGKNAENLKFKDVLETLEKLYGIEVKVLNSTDMKTVEENVKKILSGEI